jgi:hypothetical protein
MAEPWSLGGVLRGNLEERLARLDSTLRLTARPTVAFVVG